jgi:hypothetical protein
MPLPEHKCKREDLVFGNVPIEEPDGQCVSFLGRCRICGKEYHEVYSRNDGLWDPVKEKYVELSL